MNNNVYNIPGLKTLSSVDFSLSCEKSIERQAVLQITTPETYDGGKPIKSGLADQRMGTTSAEYPCATCGLRMDDCPGHFGFIKLVDPLYNVLFANYIRIFLECICIKCSKMRLSDVDLKPFEGLRSTARMTAIRKASKANTVCHRESQGCGSFHPKRIKIDMDGNSVIVEYDTQKNDDDNANGRLREPMTAGHIYHILKKISNDDCRRMGLDPRKSRPEDIIIKNLTVTPVCNRPRVKGGDQTQFHEDGHTHILVSVLKQDAKVANHLNRPIVPNPFEAPLSLYKLLVQNTLNSLQSNDSTGKSSSQASHSKRPLKGIPQGLVGKFGLVKGNLMGKRVDFSARTVISGDPSIAVDQLSIPKKIAMILTIPVKVTADNLEELQKLVDNGPSNYPGANFVIPAKQLSGGGKFDLRDLRYTAIILRIGDIAERHLQDDDVVLMNRQPTLHKMSIMGHRAKILPNETLGLNLATCGAYNADFDGDEMNVHVPQSIVTATEISKIASVVMNVVTGATSSPVLGIIQDAKLGYYLMTAENTRVSRNDALNTLCVTGNTQHPVGDGDITGRDLFSSVIPGDVSIADKIVQGTIVGDVSSKELSTIVHQSWIEISKKSSVDFMTNAQKLVNNWLLVKGFSVGFGDVSLPPAIADQVSQKLTAFADEMLYVISTTENQSGSRKMTPAKFEQNLYMRSKLVLSEMSSFVKAHIDHDNSFYIMSTAGSKGSPVNAGQIMACVGGQNIMNRRPQKTFNGRSLPYFCRDDNSPAARGFVFSSYSKGLTGPEAFFHQMGGREGMIDTALKTAEVGYTNNKLVKALEDCIAQYDYTVSTPNGQIIQMCYSGCSIDPVYMQREQLPIIDQTHSDIKGLYLMQAAFDSKYTRKVEKTLYDRLVHGRDIMRRAYVSTIGFDKMHMNTTLLTAVSIEPIIVKHVIKNKRDTSPVVAGYVWERLEEVLADPLLQTTLPHTTEWSSRNTVFDLQLLTRLCPKKCIAVHKMSKEVFDNIIEDIKRRLWSAKIQPGSAVGIIAAQSIGEPLQQMTLNTFHSAGIKSSEQLGHARVNELLNLNNKLKTPQMILPLLPGADSKRLLTALEYIILDDVVTQTDIYYKVSPEKLRQDNIWGGTDTVLSNCPYAMRLGLSRSKLYQFGLSALDIKMLFLKYLAAIEIDFQNITKRNARDIFRGLLNMAVRCSIDSGKVSAIYLFFDIEINPITYQWLIRMKNKVLKKIVMEGFSGITAVNLDKSSKIIFKDGDSSHSIEERQELVTAGINIKDIRFLKGIDFDNIRCNSVIHVYRMYGVEAAYSCLIEELERCFTSTGSNVNFHHIGLLADFMTHTGLLTSITRHGFAKLDIDILKKVSFEDVIPTLVNSAVFSESDPLHTVSSNVMLGKVPPIGTGIFSIALDVESIANAPFDIHTQRTGNPIAFHESAAFHDFQKETKNTFTVPFSV